ncbi:hypothetical protein CA13_13430 [Planctomycetes bacterium CA13]|uniref:Uncharacterized protein n=1 Tax=Novipirellula herctigrandis TaxID=2527986 RepID=A0A5C5YY07_9BACT|nr:hypothetical protein CA13_13430 [Planctomycetes bacterium CA13]
MTFSSNTQSEDAMIYTCPPPDRLAAESRSQHLPKLSNLRTLELDNGTYGGSGVAPLTILSAFLIP